MKRQFFKSSYFSSTIIEWSKLDSNIHNWETLNIFKSKILKFMRPTANNFFGCHNPIGVKLLTRLRLGLSQTQFQRYSIHFAVAEKKLKLLFIFSFLVPITDETLTLLSKIRNINPKILENTNYQITHFFLYRDENFTASTNCIILSSTIEYILATKRFEEPLFH